jgi:serine/threonine-protein phosphatase PP1 catalytic subunit
LWADPNPELDAPKFAVNERGTGVVFSIEAVREFLKENRFKMIVRAHQAVKEGYEWPFGRSEGIVTVFSASNYLGQFGNKAAVMVLDADVAPTFIQFDPVRRDVDQTQKPVPRNVIHGYRGMRW